MRITKWLVVIGCISAGCGAFSGSPSSNEDAGSPSTDAGGIDAIANDGQVNVRLDAGEDSDSGTGRGLDATVAITDAGYLHVFASEETFIAMDPATICQTLATDAGLPGTWTSWLARGNTSPLTMLGSGPWHRIDAKQTLVTTLAELENGEALEAPVLNTQHGVDLAEAGSDYEMWTGLGLKGLVSTLDCAGWTGATSATGTIGSANATDVQWTASGSVTCGNPAHIYCFQTE